MIVSADWVVPVTSRPIREGAVLVRNHGIRAVGPTAELVAAHAGEEHEHFGDASCCPGWSTPTPTCR